MGKRRRVKWASWQNMWMIYIVNPPWSPCTLFMSRMSHMLWMKTKPQPVWCHELALLCCCLYYLHFLCDILYRESLKGRSQVGRMLQASWDRSGKQQQEQNSPNLGTALERWSPLEQPVSAGFCHKECNHFWPLIFWIPLSTPPPFLSSPVNPPKRQKRTVAILFQLNNDD